MDMGKEHFRFKTFRFASLTTFYQMELVVSSALIERIWTCIVWMAFRSACLVQTTIEFTLGQQIVVPQPQVSR